MLKQNLVKRVMKHSQLYLFLLLPLLYLLLFEYVPMAGIQLAFRKFPIRDGIWGSPWIGLGNFIKFIQSYQFIRVVGNTLTISLYSLIVGFPIPIAFALILNSFERERFKKTVQTITYMPHFISTVVLVGMILQILNPRIGLYGMVHALFNGGNYPSDLLANPRLFPHIYVWSGVWQTFGWSSIIYTAALTAVSPDLHEAAQIDGAGSLKRVIHIDLPSILPTATVMLIMRCGHIMSVGFEKAFLMQNNLNLSASELISTYVYKIGLASAGTMDYAYSTAIGLFNSVINLILIVMVNAFARKINGTGLW